MTKETIIVSSPFPIKDLPKGLQEKIKEEVIKQTKIDTKDKEVIVI